MSPKVVCVNLTLLDDDGYRGEEGDERIPDSGIESVFGTRVVRQCFGSGFNLVSGSGFGSRRAKGTHKNSS
jgi:hypothetical protein